MDGIHTLAGGDGAVTIGGTQYRLAPLRLVDYATIERHLLANRRDPLALVLANLAGLEEPLQRRLLELAYDDARRGARISHAELLEWLDTHAGKIYQLWLALRRAKPELTLTDVERMLGEASAAEEAELRPALEAAAGDPWGN